MEETNILDANNDINTFFSEAIDQGRLSHCYIFSGSDDADKLSTALMIASKSLDIGPQPDILNSNHPDLIIFDGETAKIEEVRDLIKKLNLKPYQSNYKIAIITNTEKLSLESLNTLLKTLEEPVKNTIIILITKNYRILPQTVISRAQVFRFKNKVFGEKINDPAESTGKGILGSGQKTGYDISKLIEFLNFSKTEKLIKVAGWEAGELINALVILFQDLIFIKNGIHDNLNYDSDIDKLEKLSVFYDQDKVLQIMRILLKSQRSLGTNVNQKLLLDNLVLIL